MAHRDDSDNARYEPYEPYRQPSHQGLPLHHRVSALTVYDEASHHQLSNRESLVSLDSFVGSPSPNENDNDGHTYSGVAGWSGSFGYSGAGGAYAPVSATGGTPSRQTSRSGRMAGYIPSLRGPVPEDIEEEEEYDLSLLKKAAPMGKTPQYEPIAEDEHEPFAMGFDVSSALGPTTAQDEIFLKQLQEQEAAGKLTGGLGTGLRPDTTVRDADLLSSPTTVTRSLSRSFSRRTPNKSLGRFETIRNMGQDEANRRGEIIEVIVEEPAGTDLSNMEGPSTLAVEDVRRSTFSMKPRQRIEVFHPQPNWKPLSMRWPYLFLLVFLSIFLAVTQELLYQKFRKDGILKFVSPDEIKPGLYFTIKFLPTLIAVAYGVFWQFTDFEVRRLEAYHQLSRQHGALASKSINVDYITSFGFYRPIRALKLGHYAVALSSFASILAVSLVPTFAAACVVLKPKRSERLNFPDHEKEVYIASVWSRLLTSTLALCALAASGLFYTLQTRRSGLLADVRGISGLASMAVVSHILMDFKDMDTAEHKDIHQKLKHRRYMLRSSSLAPYEEGTNTFAKETEKDEETHLSENPHPLMLRSAGGIPFIVGLLLFAGFIPTFLFTPANVITDKAAFVVTALAVILKMCWGAMETSVRVMEPYYILSRRHAPSKTLMLDYTALPFGWMPIRALFNGHFLVFFVGWGSVMAEFLTIMVTSLATVDGQDFIYRVKDKRWRDKSKMFNSGQETVLSFYVSLGLVLFVLMYMMVVATVVFFRRRHPFLPRQPNTIASVLAFIHQSKMLYNFVGTSKYNSTEMAKKLDDGKTYGLGWFRGRDGQTHCGVDQEELTSPYKHGIQYLDGTKPWSTQWDVL